jgi:hypothetical protein
VRGIEEDRHPTPRRLGNNQMGFELIHQEKVVEYARRVIVRTLEDVQRQKLSILARKTSALMQERMKRAE